LVFAPDTQFSISWVRRPNWSFSKPVGSMVALASPSSGTPAVTGLQAVKTDVGRFSASKKVLVKEVLTAGLDLMTLPQRSNQF